MLTRSSQCVDQLCHLLRRKPTVRFPYILKRSEERIRKKKSLSLSLSSHVLPLPSHLLLPFNFSLFFIFILFFYSYYYYLDTCSYCLIQVRFYPETIYLFSVHFILNELSSSHFLTFEIFVKISSLKSLATYHPKNRKNILFVSEFDETFLGH